MKKTLKIILIIVLISTAIGGAFYTENLSQRRKSLMMKQYNPERLVEMMFKDSLNRLSEKAMPVQDMSWTP